VTSAATVNASVTQGRAAAETAELLEREAERPGPRIDCLSRNRDAILGYLAAVRGTL